MERKVWESFGPKETFEIGKTLGENVKPGQVYTLIGDLGVGKTAFVRGLASVLAPSARVKSPTYTVVNRYDGEIIPLYHMDVYRIEDEDDLYSIGFDDYVQNGICVVEWSENIPDSIPSDAISVSIEKEGENFEKRKITIEVKE